jgi:hypothetical protein
MILRLNFLAIICWLLLALACAPRQSESSKPLVPAKSSSVSSEQATAIAVAEAFRRGKSNVMVKFCRIEDGHWNVGMECNPGDVGSFFWVQVATNGDLIRYIGGR